MLYVHIIAKSIYAEYKFNLMLLVKQKVVDATDQGQAAGKLCRNPVDRTPRCSLSESDTANGNSGDHLILALANDIMSEDIDCVRHHE